MLGSFPPPYPDELLYSVLARMRAARPRTANIPWLRAACGDGSRGVRPCLPGGLAGVAGRIPGEHHTARRLAERHTTFPYVSRLWSDGRAAALLACLERGWPGRGRRRVSASSGVRTAPVAACCSVRDARPGTRPGAACPAGDGCTSSPGWPSAVASPALASFRDRGAHAGEAPVLSRIVCRRGNGRVPIRRAGRARRRGRQLVAPLEPAAAPG